MNIVVDPSTLVVLEQVALSWRIPMESVVEHIVYQQAAVMAGWPGELGKSIRQSLHNLRHPLSEEKDDILF